jgi:predicted RNase H-like HicB family nuclease
VIIQRAPNAFSTYTPDLPGCIATGATRREVEKNIREQLKFTLKTHAKAMMRSPGPMRQNVLLFERIYCDARLLPSRARRSLPLSQK